MNDDDKGPSEGIEASDELARAAEVVQAFCHLCDSDVPMRALTTPASTGLHSDGLD